MKHIIIHIILLFIYPTGLYSQLHNLSNQYVFNGLAINPAYAGSEDALSSTLMYRNQWVGFKGAPKTITAAIHSPIRNERVGIGLIAVNDQIGISNETSILANYAYIIEMGEGKLSFGVALGATLLDIEWDRLNVNDINDTELSEKLEKLRNPNFSAGILYRTSNFFAGLSIPFFLSYTYNSSSSVVELKNDISEYNYHIVSGYKIELSDRLKLFPSFLLKYHSNNAIQLDINSQFILHDRIWLGFTYRSEDALAFISQLAITNQFRLAYSYDFYVGKRTRYYGSSHEIMLKYVLDFNARVVGPKRF